MAAADLERGPAVPGRLAGALGFARSLAIYHGQPWRTYALTRQGDQYIYKQTVGDPAGRDVGDVGWRGGEIVAFRMHLPARILYHDAPSKQVERGNILVWEQSLAERLKGTPVGIEVRMESESILYTTVTLFGAMAVVVLSLFALIIWWVVRKGRREEGGRD